MYDKNSRTQRDPGIDLGTVAVEDSQIIDSAFDNSEPSQGYISNSAYTSHPGTLSSEDVLEYEQTICGQIFKTRQELNRLCFQMPCVISYIKSGRPEQFSKSLYRDLCKLIDGLELDPQEVLLKHLQESLGVDNKTDNRSFWVDVSETIVKKLPVLTSSKCFSIQRTLSTFAEQSLSNFNDIYLALTSDPLLRSYGEEQLLEAMQILALPRGNTIEVKSRAVKEIQGEALSTLKGYATCFARWQEQNLCTIWEAVQFAQEFLPKASFLKRSLEQGSSFFDYMPYNFALRYRYYGVPIEDLRQQARIDAARALEAFNPEKETRFKTYCDTWMKQGLERLTTKESERNGTLKLPLYLEKFKRKVNRSLKDREGISDDVWSMSAEEIASVLLASEKVQRENSGGEALSETDSSKRFERYVKWSEKILNWYRGGGDTKKSICDIDENEDGVVGDQQAQDPSRIVDREDYIVYASERVKSLLLLLPDDERLIINHRFALDGYEYKKLQELGDMMSTSREQVRLIQKRAIRRLNRMMTVGTLLQ